MRIVSDFRDFYDVAQSEGQDRTLLYERYERVEKPKKYFFPVFFNHIRYDEDGVVVDSNAVGFCGKVYPVVELRLPEPPGTTPTESRRLRGHRRFCYAIEQVDAFVQEHFPKRYDGYMTRSGRRMGQGCKSDWPTYQRHYNFKEFFEIGARQRDQFEKYFLESRCPIFVGHSVTERGVGLKNKITYNASLKDVEFFRVMDPYTAFQEISMWMGNQAEPRKPIPPITDEVMAEIKGFDKFSFRTPKKS